MEMPFNRPELPRFSFRMQDTRRQKGAPLCSIDRHQFANWRKRLFWCHLREKVMRRTLGLRNWIMVTIVALAMTPLFASAPSHAAPLSCLSRIVHAGGGSYMPADDRKGLDLWANRCCASACTLCVTWSSPISLAPEAFELGPILVVRSFPFRGQIPAPGRHPPRSAA